ncbi:Uncharacterised protein [Vibrio furnissii]|nr:Uncharacterised protein [Vibrio furnissii]
MNKSGVLLEIFFNLTLKVISQNHTVDSFYFFTMLVDDNRWDTSDTTPFREFLMSVNVHIVKFSFITKFLFCLLIDPRHHPTRRTPTCPEPKQGNSLFLLNDLIKSLSIRV